MYAQVCSVHYVCGLVKQTDADFSIWQQGQHERAARLLLPIRGNLSVLGGTSVELDVIELLLIEWCVHVAKGSCIANLTVCSAAQAIAKTSRLHDFC